MLHVMAELVREHVRLRELAGRAEAIAQLIVEAEINVDLLIERAVERPHRRLRLTASRLHAIAEENELRVVPLHAFLRNDLRPGLLRVVEHERHELHFLVLFGRLAGGWRRLIAGGRGSRCTAAVTEEREQVAVEEEAQNEHDDRAADAE